MMKTAISQKRLNVSLQHVAQLFARYFYINPSNDILLTQHNNNSFSITYN